MSTRIIDSFRHSIREATASLHDSQDWEDPYYADSDGYTVMDLLLKKLAEAAGAEQEFGRWVEHERLSRDWLDLVGEKANV